MPELMCECAKIIRILNIFRALNMLNFWIWQSSEYGAILNIPALQAFWICQNMPWQGSEYILDSKNASILNMAGSWICQSYAYICLNLR